MSGLQDKVALVTGGARGIGGGCVLEFARRGADVAIVDRDHFDLAEKEAAAVRALGRRALVISADVSDRAACKRMVQQTVAELGGLDVLVANAAYSVRKPFLELEEKDVADTLAVTLWAAFHSAQFAARHMVQQGGGGSIIFISSVHAVLAVPNSLAYNTAKAGVNHMARTMAAELAQHAIRVNVIEPGWIDTPGERTFCAEEQLREAGRALPLGRMGTSADIAQGAAYLASDDAAYVTGTILRIDGGYVLPRIK